MFVDFEVLQCLADACVFWLMEDGRVVMIIVVHVDDIFAVGEKTSDDQFGRDLNKMVLVKTLGELRWYSGCFYERDWEKEIWTISKQTFAEHLTSKYGVEYGKSVPLPVGTKLPKFNKNEAPGHSPFRELVGSLMWLATKARPGSSNAVRAVVRYCSAPMFVHWRESPGIAEYVRHERICYYFAERYSRGFELEGVCRCGLRECGS